MQDIAEYVLEVRHELNLTHCELLPAHAGSDTATTIAMNPLSSPALQTTSTTMDPLSNPTPQVTSTAMDSPSQVESDIPVIIGMKFPQLIIMLKWPKNILFQEQL